MKQIGLRLSDDLLTHIDQARGDIPREVFVRRCIEAALHGYTFDASKQITPLPELDEALRSVPKGSNTLDLTNRADSFRRATQGKAKP
jgi:hypothetical protein